MEKQRRSYRNIASGFSFFVSKRRTVPSQWHDTTRRPSDRHRMWLVPNITNVIKKLKTKNLTPTYLQWVESLCSTRRTARRWPGCHHLQLQTNWTCTQSCPLNPKVRIESPFDNPDPVQILAHCVVGRSRVRFCEMEEHPQPTLSNNWLETTHLQCLLSKRETDPSSRPIKNPGMCPSPCDPAMSEWYSSEVTIPCRDGEPSSDSPITLTGRVGVRISQTNS